jgi:hypothetical protein
MPEKNTPNLPASSTGKFLKDDGTWAAAGGGSFSGTMDDIPNGAVYVKTENNYTDADAAKVAATSGTNTGDNAVNSLYSGLAASKQDTLTNPVTGTGTNNEIAAFNSTGSTITSLATATYPSLTELSHVKGVTSAIQTQLNGKQASGSYLTSANIVGTITNGVTTNAPSEDAVFDALATKQDTLVSATNIKTINGASVLGAGDLTVSASATGILLDKQFSLLQSDGTLNAALGVQTWAGTNKTTQDVFTVAANTTYLVEGQWFVNTGATTHTTAMAWALATATVTDFQYQVMLWSSAINAVVTAQSTTHVSGVASKVLNATSTAVWTNIQFRGIMVIGTGGTVTPQINFSANPTGTNLMKRGSWTSFTRLGINTVTTAGGWA